MSLTVSSLSSDPPSLRREAHRLIDPPARAGASASASAARAATGAARPAARAVGTFKPGLPPLGIARLVVQPGDTLSSLLDEPGASSTAGESADERMKRLRSGTPSLDPQAFGTRPAAPAGAANRLQPGQAIDVLDSARLGDLSRERAQLSALERFDAPTTAGQAAYRDTLRTRLATTVAGELDYAGTQQAVPDAEALAAPIRARAPHDATFQGAVNDAVTLYRQTLQSQGRTAGQLGTIERSARAGRFGAVRTDVRSQLVATAGSTGGAEALGRIAARAGVMTTYAGGDPRFAAAVRQGMADAEHAVLVDRPVQAVQAAFRARGAVAAATLLDRVTDPQTATPGRVGQIMADPRTQAVIRQAVADGVNRTDPASGRDPLLQHLAAACQHAAYGDGATPGAGDGAVDAVAQDLQDATDGFAAKMPVLDEADWARGWASAAASQGNVALGLAFAARTRATGRATLADGALDGTRAGLHTLAGQVKTLNDRTTRDAAFLSVPAAEWGGASTAAEQAETVGALLRAQPGKADTLARDGQSLLAMQERQESARTAVAAWTAPLAGAPGFAPPTGHETADGRPWSGPRNQGLPTLVADLPIPAATGDTPAGESTNTLWLKRSVRKMGEVIGDIGIRKLGKGEDPELWPTRLKWANNVWKRGNAGLGATLYGFNAHYLLGQAGGDLRDGASVDGLLAAASGVRQSLAAGSLGLFAVTPAKYPAIRPGSKQTPLASFYASKVKEVDDLKISGEAKVALKLGARMFLQDTSDLTAASLGAANAAQAFRTGNPWEGSAQLMQTGGYMMTLTGSGVDEATGDAIVAGFSATAWTGVGAALVLAGASVSTAAGAYHASHAEDGASSDWLQAMGVKPGVADALARHATTLGDDPPSAGPFLTAYASDAGLSQARLVGWLNGLAPAQADTVATGIKLIDDDWTKRPIAATARRFDAALLQYGVMPPDAEPVSAH